MYPNIPMTQSKVLDGCWRVKLATTLLRDVYHLLKCKVVYGSEELSEARCDVDVSYVCNRCADEGVTFLTETLPQLGKAFDRALASDTVVMSFSGFQLEGDTKLSVFLHPLFAMVLTADGYVRKDACPQAVRMIRQILYLFYKLELPITTEKSTAVVASFVKTEEELAAVDANLIKMSNMLDARCNALVWDKNLSLDIVTSARFLLSRVLSRFSVNDCYPSHGPGAVSGKEKPWEKFDWTNIPNRTLTEFPLDAFFFVSMEHMREAAPNIGEQEPSARVILVPKDSRGPRLISAEPKEFQFLQQGVMRHLVSIVEGHPLCKWSVFFTQQAPNTFAALLGSDPQGPFGNSYSTLDLKDASDRVSLELVRLLFPDPVFRVLDACRSRSTVLPDGSVINLRKHAPMGSATCFPVMALCIWAILAARLCRAAKDPWATRKSTRLSIERIHVYGDDVIVPKEDTNTAIEALELFGLKTNTSKCCSEGFFRESCGMDAFKGVRVTPLRVKGDWSVISQQQRYCQYIAYANALGSAGYYRAGLMLAHMVLKEFPSVPGERLLSHESAPFLLDEYVSSSGLRRRWNKSLQIWEIRVRVATTRPVRRRQSGWVSLLRYFTEKCTRSTHVPWSPMLSMCGDLSEYTQRHDSILTWRWCEARPERAV